MPCVNSFFLKFELAAGARVAGLFTIFLSCLMFVIGMWRMMLRSNYDPTFNMERTLQYEIGASYVIFSVFFFLTSISLLLSVQTKNSYFTWPWLLTAGFAILFFTFGVIVFGFLTQILLISEQICMFLAIFLMSFFFVVVTSFKQQINNLNTIQVEITTNPPEIMQPYQNSQLPTLDGNNLQPPYPTYLPHQQSPMHIPTSSNSVLPVHFQTLFYPPPTQSNPTIKPQNPAIYLQPYSECDPYSLVNPAPFTSPKPPLILPLQAQQPNNPENNPAFLDSSTPDVQTDN